MCPFRTERIETLGIRLLENYRSKLVGLQISHVWRGHGSALFLELGDLSPKTRLDGTPLRPAGQYGVMIEWSWRIEDRSSIICGSWSEEALWEDTFRQLLDTKIKDVAVFGRLPELVIHLSGDLYVVSFMTAEGQPVWTIFDRNTVPGMPRWLHVEHGEIHEGTD